MSSIAVSVGPVDPRGQLEPRYDSDAEILAAESPVPAEWRFGVDIDGRVVFDLAEDRMLMNFDLHIGQRRWTTDPGLRWSEVARRGTLRFSQESVAAKSFHLPLLVRTDRDHELVRIDIGDSSGSEIVQLAEACIAFVRDGMLAGFILRLG